MMACGDAQQQTVGRCAMCLAWSLPRDSSSVTRINAVGEMIRVAGIRLESVALINADKSDESLGKILAPDRTVPV